MKEILKVDNIMGKVSSSGRTQSTNTKENSERERCMVRVPSLILMVLLRENSRMDLWMAKGWLTMQMVTSILGNSNILR